MHLGVHLPEHSTDLGYRLRPKAWTVLGGSGMKSTPAQATWALALQGMSLTPYGAQPGAPA